MKKIRVGFSSPKNHKFAIFSWIIKKYEDTPYSHAYIRWFTRWDLWLCYHAANTMVHFLSPSMFADQIEIYKEFEFEIEDAQFDKLMRFCITHVGKPYSLWEVLSIPFKKLGISYYTNNEKKQYCAELVTRALEAIEGRKFMENADKVGMKELYEYVKDKYYFGGKL